MAAVKQCGPVSKQDDEKDGGVENRGYWGYREITQEERNKTGADESSVGASCGCGCGGGGDS